MTDIYLDFIRYTINQSYECPSRIDSADWANFFIFCKKQGIVGLVFLGIERSVLSIPKQILFEWFAYTESIKLQNNIIKNRANQVIDYFNKEGYDCILLKGLANSLMYPHPELRSPGDIDIWVNGKAEEIIKIVLKRCPDAHYSYHHIDFPLFNDTSVEVHYIPIYLENWYANRHLQHYIEGIKELQFSHGEVNRRNGVKCLTDDFNIIYQLLHMYHHFITTRNNLKQIIDYYYLLKRGPWDNKGVSEQLRKLRVLKFARGMMWFLKNVLGLEQQYLLIEPDERIGKVILDETLCYGTSSNSKWGYLKNQIFGNVKLMNFFPLDVFISPLFLMWHQCWKTIVFFKIRVLNR